MGRSKDSPRPLLCTVLFATTLIIMLSFIVFGFILFILQNSRSEDEVIRGVASLKDKMLINVHVEDIQSSPIPSILTMWNSSIEEMVINEAKQDRRSASNVRNGLLCVTFMSAKELSNASSFFENSVQLANIFHLKSLCDWAILFYSAESLAAVDLFCSHPIVVLYGVLCRQSHILPTATSASRMLKVPQDIPQSLRGRLSASTVAVRMSVPKSAMYHELVPILTSYRSVFLLDEDISLLDVDVTCLLHTWACAFWPHPQPLIVQPLISENTQLFDYVNERPWRVGGRCCDRCGDYSEFTLLFPQVPEGMFWRRRQGGLSSKVILPIRALNCIAVARCLSITKPIPDAVEFFQWFVTRIIVHTRKVAFENGADWSADKTWCNAARNYSIEVLNWSLESIPCAIITAPQSSVHHLNTRTMRDKRVNRPLFRQRARAVMERYKTLFPNWVQEDVRRTTNPLDPINGPRYRKIMSIDPRCPYKS